MNAFKMDVGDTCSNNGCIKTEEIEIKSEETIEKGTPVEIISDIKKEDIEEWQRPSNSANNIIYIKTEHYNLDAPNRTNDTVKCKAVAYKCDKCRFATKYKSSLLSHQWTHGETRKYKCDKCKYGTNYISHLKKHQLKHKDPSEVEMFACDKCDYKSRDKDSVRNHRLVHMGPSEVQMYKCNKCVYKSKYVSCFRRHQLVHMDPSEIPMYKCNKCDYEAKYKCSITLHQRMHKIPFEQVRKSGECKQEKLDENDLKKTYY